MIRKVLLLPALLTACATGFGEAATGSVDVQLAPEGASSHGLFFESARLGIEEVDLEMSLAEPEEEGHGHAHLVIAAAVAPAQPAEPEGAPVTVDLLGGAQVIGTQELAVGSHTAAHVHLAPLGDGCILGASGRWEGAGLPVPVSICIRTGAAAPAVEIPIDLQVKLDGEAPLSLGFSVGSLLEGIDVAGLARETDGSIRIDTNSNPGAAAVIQDNLLAAFSAP